jgi:dUTP pyrophosphatase
MLPVRVRRLDPTVSLPEYQTSGAAGFDLAASQDTTVEPGGITLVPTGLVIAVPDGYFLAIFARSSTPLRRGLMVANGVGVIDSDYCGDTDEIKVQVLNVTKAPVTVAKGDRIAQGLFIPVSRAVWQEETESLRQGARGGFGATG